MLVDSASSAKYSVIKSHILHQFVSQHYEPQHYYSYNDITKQNTAHCGLIKVIEKCTNFYFGTEKLPPKF